MKKFYAHVYIPDQIGPIFTGEISMADYHEYLTTFVVTDAQKFVPKDDRQYISSSKGWCFECQKGWAIMLKEDNY